MKKTKRRKKPRKTELTRAMIREAARTGMVEAIEHCHNFWQVGDGYKKYIDHQIKTEAEALMTAVTFVLRRELDALSKQLKRRKQRKLTA